MYKAKLHKGSGISVAVAVKTIKKFKSEKETDDFLREMTVMSQMIHPNVVRLHGLVQQGIIIMYIYQYLRQYAGPY